MYAPWLLMASTASELVCTWGPSHTTTFRTPADGPTPAAQAR